MTLTTFGQLCGGVPTTVIMRHDGPSLDYGPDDQVDAVLCFPTVRLAKAFQRRCGLNRKSFPVKRLAAVKWVDMLRQMKKRGIRWINVVVSLNDGLVGKSSIGLDQVLACADLHDGQGPSLGFSLN